MVTGVTNTNSAKVEMPKTIAQSSQQPDSNSVMEDSLNDKDAKIKALEEERDKLTAELQLIKDKKNRKINNVSNIGSVPFALGALATVPTFFTTGIGAKVQEICESKNLSENIINKLNKFNKASLYTLIGGGTVALGTLFVSNVIINGIDSRYCKKEDEISYKLYEINKQLDRLGATA